MADTSNTFVLSLGGSLVVPKEGIDTKFLSAFNTFIRNQVSVKKRRFFICVGGGRITRDYQEAARAVRGNKITDLDLDWIGLHATRLNGQLLRTIFVDIADPHVLKHYEIILKIEKPVAIAAGWKPGWSTDYCAITLCADYGMKNIINLTNIDQVYDKDPKKFPDAKPLIDLTWKKFLPIVGDKWIPGLNMPFDPIASRLALKHGVTVKLLNGNNLDNLAKALDGKPFHGTTLHP